ncbi:MULTISPECIES: sulfatase [unclassified Leifsonia]|uniref:sulfatase n=1 Tax=unclassified Leifsonia TaxID=2663824 RepID=UPI0008A7355E|nr:MULTISPECIES: sulfatase [unclassified Leifsonia]SEH66556.1 Arylsulfatase A [Leifsonia sp. CL154]SFL28285.1 Arylsulfatase A [Leifsonia sp. CL147]
MRAIILMFDSLNRHMLPPYADTFVDAPNFARLARKATTFDNFYAGSMPCMPARRELHTGRHNFLHRSWGPLEPFDDSMPEMLKNAGVHTHLVSDHQHYWEDGGGTYHTRYNTWEFFRGQEGDNWKGDADALRGVRFPATLKTQDAVNRRYMTTEAEHTQTRTVDAGIEFLETNVGADRWLLQIELFDPHEPFFVHQKYRELYPDAYEGPEFDWPDYAKVVEPEDQVEHARTQYAALVSMCDFSLGRVLDYMDEHDMWSDTMLIVNTDHGFLLGEHGWWAKSIQPWFNELVHLPMFLWDPRFQDADTRRGELAQTIDIPPTVLKFFGLDPAPDMLGQDLALAEGKSGALFGIHGGHVNVTDGRYVYMRASADAANGPIEDYTLMPTHMRSRFGVDELLDWEPAEPFDFTKGLRTMRIDAVGTFRINSWQHGTLLWDLETDPGQTTPIVDDAVELRMIALLLELLRKNDAPASVFERLGLPVEGPADARHLSARRDADRARAVAAPLPEMASLPALPLLQTPVHSLLADDATRSVLDRHLPWLGTTELVASTPWATVLGMAKAGTVDAASLVAIAEELAQATAASAVS